MMHHWALGCTRCMFTGSSFISHSIHMKIVHGVESKYFIREEEKKYMQRMRYELNEIKNQVRHLPNPPKPVDRSPLGHLG